MPKWFINPNFHVILIHYPLGVLVLGVILELGSFLWRNSSVRTAAKWMIALGGLAALPALMSGIYALYQVKGNGDYPLGVRYHMLAWHVWLQSSATFLIVVVVIAGMGMSDAARRRFYLPLLVGVVIVWGLMTAGSWFGGETIYQQGTAVLAAPDRGAAGMVESPTNTGIYYYIEDPLQIHMILVSGVLACAAVGLGLAIRRITTLRAAESSVVAAGGAVPVPEAGSFAPPPDEDDWSVARSFNPEAHLATDAAPGPQPDLGAAVSGGPRVRRPVPAARFWLLAALFAFMTAAAGWWFWSVDAHSWSLAAFWRDVMLGKENASGGLVWDRRSVHVWVGLSILLMTLVLAAVARWLGTSKAALAVCATLLVLVVAAQFWLGILLAFSGTEGPLFHFDNAAAKPGGRE